MTNIKISIIIPIYNKGQYIKACLDSILQQSYKNFECLMIDDGSTDNSSAICRQMGKRDPRFRYINKKNGGVSSARNLGMQESVGEYICFVDADDLVDQNYLQTMVDPLKEYKYTMICAGMKAIKNNVETKIVPNDQIVDSREYIKTVLSRDIPIFLFQTTVCKLYSREFLVNNVILFDENINISEDCLFNTVLLQAEIDKICFINYDGYHYLQDHSTLTTSKYTYKKAEEAIYVGIKTAEIRNRLIQQYELENDSSVIEGFSKAICIIYFSNMQLIETNGFNKDEKRKLFQMFVTKMNYSIKPAIKDYVGTEKMIIKATFQKNLDKIEKIYKMKKMKARISS